MGDFLYTQYNYLWFLKSEYALGVYTEYVSPTLTTVGSISGCFELLNLFL